MPGQQSAKLALDRERLVLDSRRARRILAIL
jgi:hypothetical protein